MGCGLVRLAGLLGLPLFWRLLCSRVFCFHILCLSFKRNSNAAGWYRPDEEGAGAAGGVNAQAGVHSGVRRPAQHHPVNGETQPDSSCGVGANVSCAVPASVLCLSVCSPAKHLLRDLLWDINLDLASDA